MIKIANNKGVSADIFYDTIKSTLTDFVNEQLKTQLTFEFEKIADTIVIKQPVVTDNVLYLITVHENEVIVNKNAGTFNVPLFEDRLIAFAHIVVD